MLKLFGTYQPIEVKNILETKQDYTVQGERDVHMEAYKILSDNYGFSPIFCIPFTRLDHFLALSFMGTPRYAQSLILFESEEYKEYDYLNWRKYLYDIRMTGSSDLTMDEISTVQNEISDYCVSRIRHEQVVANILISDDSKPGEQFKNQLYSTLGENIKLALKPSSYAVNDKVHSKNATERAKRYLYRFYDEPNKLRSTHCEAFFNELIQNVFVSK